MSALRMGVICGLIFIWSILVAVFLYYHKMTVDCRTNPAIKCWNDWNCLVDPDTTSPITGITGIVKYSTSQDNKYNAWTKTADYKGEYPSLAELTKGGLIVSMKPEIDNLNFKNGKVGTGACTVPGTSSSTSPLTYPSIKNTNVTDCCYASADGKTCLDTTIKPTNGQCSYNNFCG